MNTETRLSYFAGVLDADGCFRIERKAPHGAHRSPKFTLVVTLQMAEREVIESFCEFFAVNMTTRKLSNYNYKDNKPRKTAYRFQVYAVKAANVIRPVLPYLIGKKEQARLCLEFFDEISHNKRDGNLLSDAELAIRNEFHDKVAELKRN